jgi:protein-L-isoaspartate(D-aspartate) O-methyltransferase
MNYELARHHMIQQQLRTCERMSPETVALFYADRREHYVPAAYRAIAFADCEIPLGHGASMFTPKLETRILETCALKPDDRVLEVGAGSGHLASLLAEVADHVWTVEIEPALAEMARRNLDADRVVNATVEVGDGLAGLAAHAPFDVIVVSGGVAEIPAALKAQLAEGGRLIAIVGTAPVMNLLRLTRVGPEHFVTEDLMETSVAMLRQPAKAAFAF